MATNQAQIELTATDKTRAAFDSVNQSLGKIKASAASVNAVLGAFGVSLSIGGFVAFAKSAFEYADTLQDIAAANEIATAKVLELNKALIVSGGDSEAAGSMLSKFSQYIETAVSGSEDAREKLKKLGISLKDLKTLSQEDLFDKTISGLSELGAGTEKNAIKLDIFGKNVKKVDINSLNENLKKFKGTQNEQALAAEHAAEIMDKWGLAFDNAKIKFVSFVDEVFTTSARDALKNPQRYDPEYVKQIQAEADALRQRKTAAFLAADAEKELGKIKAVRDLKPTTSETKSINEIENFIDKLKKQVATFGESKTATLEYEASQLKLTNTQKSQVNALFEQSKAQEALADAQKRTASYYGDLTAIFTVNAAEKSSVEILQTKLDLMDALPEATRNAAQAEIDLARASELYNSLQSAQNIGIDNEISSMNDLYDAEKQSADDRDKLFADTSEQLKRENEDLNVSLITNDKERVKAQADLEHQRALDRINGMILEGDQAQELIDQETKNYELRKKQIEQTNSIAKDLGLTFSSAFEEAVVGGKKFSAILQSLTQDIAKLILRKKVTEPLFQSISDSISGDGLKSFFGGLFNANGNAFNQAGVMPFANGGVFTSPQMFAYGAGNLGVLGEAGAEAILPLKRHSNGKLGVTMDGEAGGIVNNVSIVVNTDGSNRNESGSSTELGRRIESAVRGVLMQEKRPGGMLA